MAGDRPHGETSVSPGERLCLDLVQTPRATCDESQEEGDAGNDIVTPLIAATRQGHHEVMGILLEHGADVNAQDGWDQTALHHVFLCGWSLRDGAAAGACGGKCLSLGRQQENASLRRERERERGGE